MRQNTAECYRYWVKHRTVGPIIINEFCVIGKNFRVHVGVNIGAGADNAPGKCPRLGNNIYVGPGAKIFGNIDIADNCKVGANAVVNKSCDKCAISLVGV